MTLYSKIFYVSVISTCEYLYLRLLEFFNMHWLWIIFIGTAGREQNFDDKASNLSGFSSRAAKTARMVAAGSSGGNKKITEALLSSASQVN